MHPVHDAAVRVNDDRVAQVSRVHQPAVLDDVADSWWTAVVEPVGRVELSDLLQRKVLNIRVPPIASRRW